MFWEVERFCVCVCVYIAFVKQHAKRLRRIILFYVASPAVDCVWNVMAHAQKPDCVFRRNGRVHLNRCGRQFSRLLAAEVCASAVVMQDTPCSEVVKGNGYPLHSSVSPSLPLPCVTVCRHISTGLYHIFPHYLKNDTIFGKKTEHKTCCDFLYNFCLKYFSF